MCLSVSVCERVCVLISASHYEQRDINLMRGNSLNFVNYLKEDSWTLRGKNSFDGLIGIFCVKPAFLSCPLFSFTLFLFSIFASTLSNKNASC